MTARSSDRAAGDALDARHDVQTPGRDLRFSRAEAAAVAQDACSPTIALSTASLACKFGTSTAAVEAIPGATYTWTAQNASITSGVGTNAVTLAFGAASNASVSASVTAGTCVSVGAASITLRDPFQVGSFFADTPSPRLGDRVTLRWSYTTADAPKSQTLTITAPAGAPSVVKLPADDRSYSFVVNSVGAWSAMLEASLYGGRRRAVRSGTSTLPPPSPCATDTRAAAFVVGAACDTPEATVSGGGQACAGDGVGIRADFSGTPPFSGQWSDGATFTTDASSVTRTVASSGSYTLTSFSDATCSGLSSGQATVTIKPAPAITTFTVPTPVGAGQTGTITFAYSNGTSFVLTSSLNNTFSTCCSSSSTGGSVTYNRDFAEGPDTITLTVTGPCGTASSSRVITDPSPSITSFSVPSSVAPSASGTITFAYTNGTSYSFTSSLGNTFTPSGGDSSSGGSVVYSRDVAHGSDTITLTVTGPGGTASASRVIADPSPVITSFSVPSSVAPGASGTITFTYTGGTSYLIQSNLGNSVSATSGTSTTGGSITYTRDTEYGDDTIRLTVVGPGGSISADRVVSDPSPTASVFTISKNPVPAGDFATINFTITKTTAWNLMSSLGNTLSPSSGSGSGSFSVTYTADNAVGTDTVTLTLNGPGGTRVFSLHPAVN
ncbi:MAG: hypothetical protein WB973_16840 [Thermoanaerobaculia bacterium]